MLLPSRLVLETFYTRTEFFVILILSVVIVQYSIIVDTEGLLVTIAGTKNAFPQSPAPTVSFPAHRYITLHNLVLKAFRVIYS